MMQIMAKTQYGPSPEKARLLEGKWSRLLKGIEDPEKRTMTAILLENQEQELKDQKLLTEATVSGSGFPTSSGAVDKFPKLVIPMVRRIMPQLISNEIFGVQAMEGPVGMAFSMRWVYDTDKTWTDAYGRTYTTNAGDEAYVPGPNGEINPTYSGDKSTPQGGGYDTGTGEVLAEFEFDTATGQVNDADPRYTEGSLKIVNRMIEAKTRKLKANWSQEAVDDIKKVHSINLEEEIMDFLSYQIQAEIDRELIGIAYGLGTTNALFTWDVNSTDGRWQEEKYKTLYHAIIKALNYVGYTTRRGRANWMIVSTEVASILSAIKAFDYGKEQPIQGFTPYENGEGVVFLGTIEQGKVRVYLDLYWRPPVPNTNKEIGYILLGYKGSKSWDSGLIYTPYIPIMLLKTIEPNQFHPVLSLGTRYGVVDDLLDTEKYYAVISLRDSSL